MIIIIILYYYYIILLLYYIIIILYYYYYNYDYALVPSGIILCSDWPLKLLRVLFFRHSIDKRSNGFRLSLSKHGNRCGYPKHLN